MSQFCRSLLAVKRQGDFHDGGREPHASLDELLGAFSNEKGA